MKTLANHQLIYDKDCPMCRVYSGAFVKSKMLDENGRQNYRDLSAQTKSILDLDRARNEIALVNYAENKTYYGLDSLLIIIGNSFPLLEKIGRLSFIYWFFQKLYSLVSYNRKQIIPSKNDALENACVPDFNFRYRFMYLISGILFSAFLLSYISIQYGQHIRFWQLFISVIFVFCIQIISIFKSGLENIFNFIGNLNTVLIAFTLILSLISVLHFSMYINRIFLILLLILSFVEYFRRINILKNKKLIH